MYSRSGSDTGLEMNLHVLLNTDQTVTEKGPLWQKHGFNKMPDQAEGRAAAHRHTPGMGGGVVVSKNCPWAPHTEELFQGPPCLRAGN